MTKRPSLLTIGIAARSERSWIASRRFAKAQRRSALHQEPAPSGPRARIASRVMSNSRSVGAPAAE